jgi:hypothetical protein
MNRKTLQLLTDPELVAMRQAWEQRLQELSDVPIYLQGKARTGKTDMYENAGQRAQEALDDLAKRRAAENLDVYPREMPEKVYHVNSCEGMPIDRVEELAKTHKIVICAEPVH